MVKVEKARISDAAQMHKLINYFAGKGQMLARPLSELYESIRDFSVARERSLVVGCASLHVNWEDLAEIKSLAVAEKVQSKGIGGKLVKACIEEARGLGIPTVFCLTYRPEFFEKLGFTRVDRMSLPRKVWVECYRCAKFPDCDETALVYKVEGIPTAQSEQPMQPGRKS
ncbi:MAG: N-acetyltransferase [Dehalococcoidia bacterium]|nr:N-acetyltransferase [Dehalococcoidia bacterium]